MTTGYGSLEVGSRFDPPARRKRAKAEPVEQLSFL